MLKTGTVFGLSELLEPTLVLAKVSVGGPETLSLTTSLFPPSAT